MSAPAIAWSSMTTSLNRYLRSWGLWALLVTALVGSRFFVSRDDGTAIVIAVHNRLPVLTSAMLGVSLGVVVSTLLLPVGFIYLRANTTKRQPWQIEEVTIGSRVAVALGRFKADVVVFAAVLVALSLAGFILALLRIPLGEIDPGQIVLALWLIAGPALMGVAALRILFDAAPWMRSALGDVAFYVLWMTALVVPVTVANKESGLAANLRDFTGFVRPLTHGQPPGSPDVSIGASFVQPGHIPLDVMGGLMSPGYIESRLIWCLIAVAVAVLAGLLYQPHRPRKPVSAGPLSRWLTAGPPRPADPLAPAARAAALPWLGLLVAEFRLIGPGRLFPLVALGLSLIGLVADYRHAAGPATLLLLIFGLSAQAGRSEARGLLALTSVASLAPNLRRFTFVVAGTAWALLLAVPSLIVHPSLATLGWAIGSGAAASVAAIALATLSRSAFAPRLVLLIAWYAYLSS